MPLWFARQLGASAGPEIDGISPSELVGPQTHFVVVSQSENKQKECMYFKIRRIPIFVHLPIK